MLCTRKKIQKYLKVNVPESGCGIRNHQINTPVCGSLTTELTYKLVIKKHWCIISYRELLAFYKVCNRSYLDMSFFASDSLCLQIDMSRKNDTGLKHFKQFWQSTNIGSTNIGSQLNWFQSKLNYSSMLGVKLRFFPSIFQNYQK